MTPIAVVFVYLKGEINSFGNSCVVVAKRQKAYKNVRFERGNRIYNELGSQPDSGLFLGLMVQLGWFHVFEHG